MILVVVIVVVILVVVIVVVVIMVVMMMLMVTATVVVVMLFLFHQLHDKIILFLHGIHDLCAGNIIPRSSDNGCLRIFLPDHSNNLIQLLLGELLGSAQHDTLGALDLIVVEFAEVFHKHFALHGICHSSVSGKLDICLICHFQHSLHDVRQLAHAGGLDDDPVRGELL